MPPRRACGPSVTSTHAHQLRGVDGASSAHVARLARALLVLLSRFRTSGAATLASRKPRPARAAGLTIRDLLHHGVVGASDVLRGPHLVVAGGQRRRFGALAGHCRSSCCDSVSGRPKHGRQRQRAGVGCTSRFSSSEGCSGAGTRSASAMRLQTGMLAGTQIWRVAFGRLCQRAPAHRFPLRPGKEATAGAVGADAAACV